VVNYFAHRDAGLAADLPEESSQGLGIGSACRDLFVEHQAGDASLHCAGTRRHLLRYQVLMPLTVRQSPEQEAGKGCRRRARLHAGLQDRADASLASKHSTDGLPSFLLAAPRIRGWCRLRILGGALK